jgi:peptidoglycan/LPS O-acetylase OafA/YrhL
MTQLPLAEPRASRANHLEALTGLRMLAALAVYIFHVGVPPGTPLLVGAFVASGYMGVTVFFTLSGFVLGLNYFESLRHPSAPALWGFAVARFARLAPLYFLVLLFVIVTHLVHGDSIAEWPEHALALQAWDPSLARAWALNGVAWSVSVEVFLYACLPVVVLLVARLGSARALVAAAAGVIALLAIVTLWFALTGRGELAYADPGSAHRWLYRTPLLRLGDFTLGVLAARLYLAVRDHRYAARAGGALALAAAAVIVIAMAWPGHAGTVGSWDFDYAVPATFLVFGLACAPSGILARLLSLPIMVLLGEASYAFFMTHRRILNVFNGNGGAWSGPLTVASATYELMLLGLVICLSVGLYLLFERPSRAVLRRLGPPSRG